MLILLQGKQKGFLLVLATALISGFSIFINKYAVVEFDPLVFTAMKNTAVALALATMILAGKKTSQLMKVPKKQVAPLLGVGVLGGSVPFLLFFQGLSQANPAAAAAIHKSMLIPVAFLAYFFLGEKLSKKQVAASATLFTGLLLLSGINALSPGPGEALILLATLLWSIEITLSKKLLRNIEVDLVVFARMGFGATVLFAYLALTGGLSSVFSLTMLHLEWLMITSALLVGYVCTFYRGLRELKAPEAAAVLMLGSAVTTALNTAYSPIVLPWQQFGGAILLALGTCGLVVFAEKETSKALEKTSPKAVSTRL